MGLPEVGGGDVLLSQAKRSSGWGVVEMVAGAD